MGTFGAIKTEVANWLIDTPTAVSANIPTQVLDALRAIQDEHDFKVMEAETTYTTTVNSNVLSSSLPANFKKWRDADPYLLRNNGTVHPIVQANHFQNLPPRFDGASKGEPRVLVLGNWDKDGAGNIQVYPTPNGTSDYSGGEFRIVVPYYAYLSDPVNDADTNWFMTNGHNYVVFKAVANGFFQDWDEERGGVWLQRALVEQKRLIKRDKILRLSGAPVMVPHWRGARQERIRL